MPQNKEIEFEIASEEDVDFIVDNGRKYFEDSGSLPLFQMTDFEYVRGFFKSIVKETLDAPYFLISIKDKETGELVGAVLFSVGNPWYNNKIKVISEELTLSFKKGYGISRAIAWFMAYYVSQGKADVATGASAQTIISKEVENSYKKVGYKSYPTFYFMSEAIEHFNNKEQ